MFLRNEQAALRAATPAPTLVSWQRLGTAPRGIVRPAQRVSQPEAGGGRMHAGKALGALSVS